MASTTTERPPPRPKRVIPESTPRAVEPWRVTQRLTRRVGMLGVVLLVVFAALFLRLWALQVLAGTKYVDQAGANSYRTVRVQAPRGSIVDRDGQPARDQRPGDRGAAVAGRPAEGLHRALQRSSSALVASDAGAAVRDRGRHQGARDGDPLTPGDRSRRARASR